MATQMKTQEVLHYFSYLLGHVEKRVGVHRPPSSRGFRVREHPALLWEVQEKRVSVNGSPAAELSNSDTLS